MYDLEQQKINNKKRYEEDLAAGLVRMCSMCGEVKTVDNFKMKNRKYRKTGYYYSYCNKCNKLYMKEYMRIYRERKD